MFGNVNSKIIEITIYCLISLAIFITIGENLIDYYRFFFLKTLLILIILTQINFIQETKAQIKINSVISIIILLFIISVSASYIISPYDLSYFAYEWLRVRYIHILSDIFLFICLYFYFKKKDINYKFLTKSIIIPGIIFVVFLLIVMIFNKKITNDNQYIIFFDGTRQVGILITFLISFYLGCKINKYFSQNTLISVLITSLYLTLAIFLWGRGSLLSILITYLFVFFTIHILKKDLKKEFLILVISLILAFSLSYSLSLLIVSDESLKKVLIRDDIIRDNQNLGNIRLFMWEYSLNNFFENPLFGKGPGSFYISTFNEMISGKLHYLYVHTQPHNLFFQFIFEWGLIGSSLLLFLFLKLFLISSKQLFKNKNSILLIPGLGIISLTIHSMVDGSFFHPTFTFYIVVCLSVLCSEINKINHRL